MDVPFPADLVVQPERLQQVADVRHMKESRHSHFPVVLCVDEGCAIPRDGFDSSGNLPSQAGWEDHVCASSFHSGEISASNAVLHAGERPQGIWRISLALLLEQVLEASLRPALRRSSRREAEAGYAIVVGHREVHDHLGAFLLADEVPDGREEIGFPGLMQRRNHRMVLQNDVVPLPLQQCCRASIRNGSLRVQVASTDRGVYDLDDSAQRRGHTHELEGQVVDVGEGVPDEQDPSDVGPRMRCCRRALCGHVLEASVAQLAPAGGIGREIHAARRACAPSLALPVKALPQMRRPAACSAGVVQAVLGLFGLLGDVLALARAIPDSRAVLPATMVTVHTKLAFAHHRFIRWALRSLAVLRTARPPCAQGPVVALQLVND
mmetsp:Transcript_91931/g.263301  ORF Transcript_91931/g.263301 Transcript_91931/m.263301 type:complete len:380 (-) Transcript_91931:412-1551(-)